MFNKDEKGQKDAETVVGASVLVKGDFVGKGNIIIEGSLEGHLNIEGDLYAGEKSVIIANIKAREAKILGQVTGEIILEGLLDLGPKSEINGNVQVGSLSIANGACVNGQISMHKNSKTQAPGEKKE